jgi:hypothetical protein
VTGGQGPRDWDKELAQIDKLIATGAAEPQRPAAPPAGPAATAARPRPRAALFTWVRLVLGLLIGVGITQWPYERGCGLLLFSYLGAVAGVIVAGMWSAVSSWRTRSSVAHVLALGLVAWGGILGAREVLPRVGYAKTGATWLCTVGGGTGAPSPAPTTTPGAF